MNERQTRIALVVSAATMLVTALVFLIAPPQIGRTIGASTPRTLAAHVARHPTDWEATSLLAETALDDGGNPRRVELWHASFEHALALAPQRAEARNAFARGAFFHWNELSPRDQQAALAAYAPLLRDPTTFFNSARPIFELTGNLQLLRKEHPPGEQPLGALIELAVRNGLFDDYRELRAELQKLRLAELSGRLGAPASELIAQLPPPPYHADTEPILAATLDALHRQPLDDDPHHPEIVDGLVDYAVRHDLTPLDGLEVITRKEGSASAATRVALAHALGLTSREQQLEMLLPTTPPPRAGEWAGLCQTDICDRAWRDIDAAHGISVTLATVQSDDVPAYAELYVDDALRDEGAVGRERAFILPAGSPGVHRVEVRLVNGRTRNGAARRIRVVSITAL